jgi:hypothetical protein
MLKLAGTLRLVTTVTTDVVVSAYIRALNRFGTIQTVDRAPDVIRGSYFNHIVLQDSPYRACVMTYLELQAG